MPMSRAAEEGIDFVDGTTCTVDEAGEVAPASAAVTFGDICRDGEGGAPQLAAHVGFVPKGRVSVRRSTCMANV